MSEGAPAAVGPVAVRTTSRVSKRNRAGWAAVATVLVVAAVVAGLWAMGLPPFSGPAAGGVTALSYSSAAATATAAATPFHGGGWVVIMAAAYNLRAVAEMSVPSMSISPGCAFVPTSSSVSRTYPVPAVAGSPGSGASPAWMFLLRNATGGTAFVSVIDGSPIVLGTVTQSMAPHSPPCTWNVTFGWYHAMPVGTIDSAAAVASANGAGGATFLADHPDATAMLAVMGGFTGHMTPAPPAAPTWTVTYATCSPTSSVGAPGMWFTATVNATTGAVTTAATTATVCGSWPFPTTPNPGWP